MCSFLPCLAVAPVLHQQLHVFFPSGAHFNASTTHSPTALPPLPASLQAYAPRYPLPKEENWYFLLADPAAVGGRVGGRADGWAGG
jgi:hypothetical protein